MAIINLKRLEVYTDLKQTNCVVADVREQLADLMYNYGTGIAGHALAHKINDSDEVVELSESESRELIRIVEECCRIPVIDAIHRAIESGDATPTQQHGDQN